MPSLPKKLTLLFALAAVAQASSVAHAGQASNPVKVTAQVSASTAGRHFNLVLAGSSAPNEIHISLSADGRTYVIDSSSALEAGDDVCANPPENPDELTCEAAAIDGFWFNGGASDDVVCSAQNDCPRLGARWARASASSAIPCPAARTTTTIPSAVAGNGLARQGNPTALTPKVCERSS